MEKLPTSCVIDPCPPLPCLCLPLQDLEGFLSFIIPTLERISFAFSRVVLVCEGHDGFQSQLLCGTDRLLGLAHSLGLQLQCYAVTDAAATQAIVGAITRAYLVQWCQLEPSWQYPMADVAPEEETFLTGFYSINPHSAALLASLGLPMQHLLQLEQLRRAQQLPPALQLVPAHSLVLLGLCASWGTPMLGGHPAASTNHLATVDGMHRQLLSPAVVLSGAAERSEQDCYPSPAQASVHIAAAHHLQPYQQDPYDLQCSMEADALAYQQAEQLAWAQQQQQLQQQQQQQQQDPAFQGSHGGPLTAGKHPQSGVYAQQQGGMVPEHAVQYATGVQDFQQQQQVQGSLYPSYGMQLAEGHQQLRGGWHEQAEPLVAVNGGVSLPPPNQVYHSGTSAVLTCSALALLPVGVHSGHANHAAEARRRCSTAGAIHGPAAAAPPPAAAGG